MTRLRVALVVLAMLGLMIGHAEAGKPRATPTATATPTPGGTPSATPTPTEVSPAGCPPVWSPTGTYSGGSLVSKQCGYDSTYSGPLVWFQFTAYTNPTGEEPCTDNAPASNMGIPWALPYNCGPVPTHSGTGYGNVVSKAQFNTMLPFENNIDSRSNPPIYTEFRRPEYTYENFVAAAQNMSVRWPAFCNTGDSAKDSRECAAFMANVAHETLHGSAIDEVNTPQCPSYCDTTVTDPGCLPVAGQAYYGRGPIQLSWNFNYCAAGKDLYPSNPYFLVQHPNTLGDPTGSETDPVMSIQSAVWYWMTQEGPNNGTVWDGMSAHLCMQNDLGFGCTIRAINGAIECPALGARDTTGVRNARNKRISYYRAFVNDLGSVSIGDDDCINAP